MKLLAVDDEELSLRDLKQALAAVNPGFECVGMTSPRKAEEYARSHPLDIAFLDVEMGATNGLALAKTLKDVQPNLHIVFVTSHDKYAVDAFAIHATGYLLKPVSVDDIRRELTFVYRGEGDAKRIRVQTFGGFDVFVDEEPILFPRSKAKELLAYLVDRRGSSITVKQACNVLFDDGTYNTARKNYFQTIAANLRSALENAGAEQMLIKRRNSLAVDTNAFTCDSYRFFEGDPAAVNSYRHDYLPLYSWAEFSMAKFEPEL